MRTKLSARVCFPMAQGISHGKARKTLDPPKKSQIRDFGGRSCPRWEISERPNAAIPTSAVKYTNSVSMPQRVRLTVVGGPQDGVSKECWPGERLTVGRAATADVTVYDVRLSRAHFQVRRESGQWIVEDLRSQNGTSIDDTPVLSQCLLSDGDRIQAGDSEFKVDVETGRIWFRDSAGSWMHNLYRWLTRPKPSAFASGKGQATNNDTHGRSESQ